MAKKILILLTLIMSLALCACGGQSEETVEAPEVTGEFSVSVLDVGKADAIILRTANHTVLIDCGEKGDGKDILEKLAENGIDNIDYLFITHFDKDHVGGAAKLINGISIDNIITPKYEGVNNEYENYMEAVSAKGISPNEITESMTFTLDDVLFEVYPPRKSYYAEGDNDYSLVISVTHGENTFLFAGDAEEERLTELSGQMDLSHTFLKVPHHGRYNSNTKQFLQRVNPQYAVITCSEKNPPEEEVLGILSALGTEVYLTDNGDINAVSDGVKIEIQQ
ncbi:MAG: MBL fold metallo-hydrolase [Oscillospiraceae bacterium]|nr:MBL fold metallo-hydrolase [Oscillospiraceae bacterium]